MLHISEIMHNAKYDNIPVATIVDGYGDDAVIVGYLSPFRGSKFQVSRTPEGELDMGGTTDLGLGNVMNLYHRSSNDGKWLLDGAYGTDVQRAVFEALIVRAVTEAAGYPYLEEFAGRPIDTRLEMSCHKYNNGFGTCWQNYAYEVIEWIKSVQ